VTSPIPVPEKYKSAALRAGAIRAAAILPKGMRDMKASPILALSSLGMGAALYSHSTPRAELGGKSRLESDYQADVLSNKAKASDEDGLPTAMRHRMKEFQSGLATDFRKHPIAAAGIASALGYMSGSKLVKVLGGLR